MWNNKKPKHKTMIPVKNKMSLFTFLIKPPFILFKALSIISIRQKKKKTSLFIYFFIWYNRIVGEFLYSFKRLMWNTLYFAKEKSLVQIRVIEKWTTSSKLDFLSDFGDAVHFLPSLIEDFIWYRVLDFLGQFLVHLYTFWVFWFLLDEWREW